MQQSLVTLAIPFEGSAVERVQACLDDDFGNPTKDRIKHRLDETQIVHFMSITVPPVDDGRRQLVIEFSADGDAEYALTRVSQVLQEDLQRLLETAGLFVGPNRLREFLARHRIKVGQGWFVTPGLDYSGTPGMTVRRLKQEQRLASTVATMLDDIPRASSALETLQAVRCKLWAASEKWAFAAEPAPCLQERPDPNDWRLYARLGLSAARVLLWPFLLLAAVPLFVVVLAAVFWPLPLFFGIPHHFVVPLFVGVSTAIWATAAIVAVELILLGAAYFRLLHLEKTDIPQDHAPPKAAVDAAMRHEAFAFQNHLAASSVIKPGWLRMFTLRIGLWIAGQIGVIFSRPSFLGDTGVIHFARWVVLPKTRTLLFFSNYDGAWESYIEDFIEEAHFGVTGIWSNTAGFPRTSNLFFEGAVDGDRLRRWTRCQQYPSLFWYTAYPKLTLARMRTNAAIRQGIACAQTEAEAADWLACFGSAPRPADTVESGEITTLAFGGLKHMPFGKCSLLRLPDSPARAKEWLAAIENRISYGSTRDHPIAVVVAFSAHGLRKLGLTDRDIATFPVAFQDGMHAEWRARALGDPEDPQAQLWGRGDQKTDALLLLYARSQDGLRLIDTEVAALGAQLVRDVPFTPLTDPAKEPFGFVDGISQPVLRGVGDWTKRQVGNQLVEPGEIILGYTDNAGYIPPSPSVPASADPGNSLPAAHWDPTRPRLDFSTAQPTADHDFGCNGSFLVVRQLQQDRDQFEKFLCEKAKALIDAGCAPSGRNGEKQVKDWIAAKMVGRWKNGSSLVRHPNCPGPKADNEFAFGTEDATGQRCPFGAHIRRANPRDTFDPGSELELKITNRHRILRVGRFYGEGEERDKPGLVFMCLNADIERQFEFIQQTWIRGPSFNALQDEMDPIVGSGPDDAVFTIPLPAGPPLRLTGLKQFVTLLGGEYFFVPGKRAIRYLVASGGKG